MAEDWRTAYGRVKMELEEYKETIVPALMDKIRELEKRWVPVTERLPKTDGRYLCNVKSFAFPGNYYQAILRYYKEGFLEANIYTDDVTHWMPLPEPPKEAELRGDTD